MNVQFRPETVASVSVKTAIADCDIHPARATNDELYPFLAKRWHEHLETYGSRPITAYGGPPYPKAQPNASRRDAWPPGGGPQGSSLSLHAEAAARSLQCRARRAQSAEPAGRALRNQDLPPRSARRSTSGRSRNGPARSA